MPGGFHATLGVERAAYAWIRALLEGGGITARDLPRADRSNHVHRRQVWFRLG